MSVPIAIVQKWAPSVKFHPNEQYFPCGIEYMLQSGNLRQQTFRSARQIAGQHTSTPALAFLDPYLVMVYTNANSSQLWCSRSTMALIGLTHSKFPGNIHLSQL